MQAAMEAEQGLQASATAPDKDNKCSLADQVLADLLTASTEGCLAGHLYGEQLKICGRVCAHHLTDMIFYAVQQRLRCLSG